jgi:anti-sigma factor RsiW
MTQDDTHHADAAERLQALLSGSLSPAEMRRVLALVARDDGARRLLDEMLALERTVRAAYGYDRTEEKMKDSLASLLASLGAGGIPAAWDPAGAARRPAFRMRWVLGALAASVVVAASLYVAISTHLLNRSMRGQLNPVLNSAALPKVTETEKAGYSRIWSEVAQAASGPTPWILLSNGGGEFGYLPSPSAGAGEERLLLVRCLVTPGDDGRVQTINLLVPARRNLRLSLPEIAHLAGQPVACDIAMYADSATVGLTVGKGSADAVGVRGRVGFGDRSVEIGEFLLGGRPMRIVVQAVPLGAVG